MGQKLVVIGAGMASGRAIERVLEADPQAFDITLIGAEPRGNYNRIMLSPVLSGEKTYDEIITHDADWYAANGVTTRFGEAVTGIDRARKVVVSDAGETPYDKLLIATGSNPFIIPVPGHDLPGVISYRDLDDTNAMISAAEAPGAKAVVIGGGLLGLEAAAGLKLRGMDVTVIHLMDHLMERQLDPAAGHLLQRELESRGITVHCGANTKQIRGEGRVEVVLLEDGRVIKADMVVMAVGIRPNTALGRKAGLAADRGLQVDDQMRSTDADVLAIGECVEHRGQCYGLVAPLYDMANVAAKTLLGEVTGFEGIETSTKLKVTGVDLFSAGDFAPGGDREEIIYRDVRRGIYKRLVIKDNRIIGVVMYGDTADGAWFLQKLKEAEDIAEIRDALIFGPMYAGGGALDPMAAVAALPDEAEICGSNGVNKGQIISVVQDGATTLDTVPEADKSKARSTGCVEVGVEVGNILPDAQGVTRGSAAA